MDRIAELKAELKELRKKLNQDKKKSVDKNKPRTRYTQQKCQADKRKIEWLFTFETWWQMWEISGKWNERGRKKGQYCMARKGDIGPYSPDNVEIILITQNSSDAHTNGRVSYGHPISAEHKERLRLINIGKPQSAETRKKKSEANKKPWGEKRRATYEAMKAKGIKSANQYTKRTEPVDSSPTK